VKKSGVEIGTWCWPQPEVVYREFEREREKTYFSFYGMASKPSKNTVCPCVCVCVCVTVKRRGLFCPPALSFLGDLECILYGLPSTFWVGEISTVMTFPCLWTSRLHGGGSDPKRIRSHRDQRNCRVEELHRWVESIRVTINHTLCVLGCTISATL